MTEIHKITLTDDQEQTIFLPRGSVILSCHNQRDAVCVWYITGKADDKVPYTFFTLCTGAPQELPQWVKFLGAVIRYDGDYVVHIFYQS